MTPEITELCIAAREQIFDSLGTIRLRAETAQRLCELAHDEALHLVLKELANDFKIMMGRYRELQALHTAEAA